MSSRVIADIEIEYVRLLSFDVVRDFLSVLALHICDPSATTNEHLQAQQAIERAMTAVLWNRGKTGVLWPDLEGEDYGEIRLSL